MADLTAEEEIASLKAQLAAREIAELKLKLSEPMAYPPERATRSNLSNEEQTLVEATLANDGPRDGIAWLMWWLFGLIGGHRMYLKRGVAIYLLSWLVGAPIIWVFVDAARLGVMIRQRREEVRASIIESLAR